MATKQEFDLLAGAEGLPAEAEWSDSRSAAVGALVVGLGALGFALFGALQGFRQGLPFIAFGGILGVIMLLVGPSRLLSRREYAFGTERIECSGRGLLGSYGWEEPISAYRGIQSEAEHHHGKGPDYTLYKLILKHADDDSRDVALYQSLKDHGLRARQEEYARMFGLSALVKTDDGAVERRPEDLDKSLRQRVAEGSLHVGFDASEPPPGRRLSLFIEGDTLRIRSKGHPIPLIVGGLGVLFGVAALASGPLGIGFLRGVPTWVGVAALVVGVGLLGCYFLLAEELLVSPSEVRRHYRCPWGTFSEQSLDADQIEDVLIAQSGRGQNVKTVQAISDAGRVCYGASLSGKQRRWVRDCVLAVITR